MHIFIKSLPSGDCNQLNQRSSCATSNEVICEPLLSKETELNVENCQLPAVASVTPSHSVMIAKDNNGNDSDKDNDTPTHTTNDQS